MKSVLQCALGSSFAATLYGQVTVKEPIPQTAMIEVNAAAVSKQEIPRTLCGTFLEPYSNSIYNRLGGTVAKSKPGGGFVLQVR